MTKTKIPNLIELIIDKKFDWVNSSITDTLFETPTEIGTDFKLYSFGKEISSEDVINEMNNDGYRPANAWELLSWKGWNRNDSVIALGSVGEVVGSRRVPYLGRSGSERYLGLDWWGGGWSANDRFLAVRNSTLENSDTLLLAIEQVKKAGYIIYKQL